MTVTGQVVVVTGPPGAGKSTVSRLLTRMFSPSVHLHTDDFWSFIAEGAIPPYLPEARRQNEVVMDVLVEAAFGYARGGYQVVLDGVVGPWFIGGFLRAAKTHDVCLRYVVLRPDEATTLARAAGRGPDALTEREPVLSMYRQFQDLGALERCVLDSGGQAPEATAEHVRKALSAPESALWIPGGPGQ
ncbi:MULTISPECIES: AAA family ATPase [Streptomyces]|uniref:AAA family ATPase n=1 Tax=Streptomyces lycii TaxID=2654337 RepID=A0ABQ7FBU7_9ACTN|nr:MULTISPECIES: AAA family ATPase [Streptomyces]KAF4406561.1 AAA family ATPase [Streptomyces lycii]PGH47285.1 shikimate kinase [Streptomyces sp. Ru87]